MLHLDFGIMKTQSEVVKALKAKIEYQKKFVEESFYYQSEDQLTAKKSEDKWSAAQCFEHLNLVNTHYISELDNALPKTKATQKDLKYSAGLIGSYMIKSMRLKNGEVKNKTKTFKHVRPLAEREPGSVVKIQPVFTNFFCRSRSIPKNSFRLRGQKHSICKSEISYWRCCSIQSWRCIIVNPCTQ